MRSINYPPDLLCAFVRISVLETFRISVLETAHRRDRSLQCDIDTPIETLPFLLSVRRICFSMEMLHGLTSENDCIYTAPPILDKGWILTKVRVH